MAFSIFLRNSACRAGSIFRQQMIMATKHDLTQCPLASVLPHRTPSLNEANTSLILSRSISTSAVRMSDEKPHDHARLWVIEKATSALLVPLVPIGLLMPNKIVDCALALLICAHSFWGLEAIAVDYVRASIFGPVIPKIAIGLVYLISIATLGGLFYLISHDVGLCNAVKQFWSVRAKQQPA